MPSTPAGASRSGTQSIDRAVELLHAVARSQGGRASTATLAEECGLTKATAWRLLSSLESHGLIWRDSPSGSFGIGFAMYELAALARDDGLVASARPMLAKLSQRSGETANLAVYRAPLVRYVDEVKPETIVSASWAGRQTPLHASSTGKAILAWLPQQDSEALIDRQLEALTSRTIASMSALRQDLARTRRRGYATCVGECETGLNGVSAPLVDSQGYPIVVVSVWGTEQRVPHSRLPELGSLVRDAAEELAAIRPALHTPPAG